MNLFTRSFLPTAVITASFLLAGCGQPTAPATDVANSPTKEHASAHGEPGHSHGQGGHVHGGWWCDEHGVPESECAQCDSKVAAKFQKTGDWCKEHNRPDSQCFLCHPEKLDEFAARYVAKYGKKPPKPTLH
jgi:hypothetical protein